ncbi:hypothetical protein AnigIFM49718_003950 [Aspergillus niger]|nr:hypothetical protein AnigIFM49718_003950 [Aspergillus niger]
MNDQNAGETAIGSGNDRLEGGRLFRDPQVPDSPTDRLESNCWSVRDAPPGGLGVEAPAECYRKR